MVQVKVSEGIVEGELIDNEFGGSFYSFKGIPYAEPPVGDLRFKAPRPKKPWNGVRSAKEHGPISYQFDKIIKQAPLGSEDCLYLNVYTPDVEAQKLLPVMFWIHGGAFVCGSGNDDLYGPEFLVRQDVVLVTCNYRVEVLGFLSLGTEDIPGNAGMKDQVAALRWVSKNISKFGGDPENVTIFGESAGGASVTFHLISPMSKGLFKRAIAQSGAATCSWSVDFKPRERALALARELGLNSENDTELYEFFKAQPVESLININVPITFTEAAKESLYLQFGIVSEKQFGDNDRFFNGDVFDAVSNGIHEGVEVIAGYCEDEGYLSLGHDINIEKLLNQANKFSELFTPQEITQNCPLSARLEAGKKLKEFYFSKEKVTMEKFDQLVEYFSLNMFIYGIVQWQKITACKNLNNVYLYKFTCKSERNLFAQVMGLGKYIGEKTVVCHADDLPYLFHMRLIPFKVDQSSKTFNMIENVTKLWTNFAKYGNPTPDNSLGVKWAPYTLQQQQYLDIGSELVLGSKPDEEAINFWEDIFRQYLPQCVVDKS